MAVAVAIIRGIIRRGRRTLGNFWVDLVRSTLRILLPLSFIVAIAAGRRRRGPELRRVTPRPRRSTRPSPPRPASRSRAARWPARSPSSSSARTAAASTTPTRRTRSRTRRRSPTSSRLWAILVIPFAFVVMYGRMVGSKKQARVLLAVMAGIWLAVLGADDGRRGLRQPRPGAARRRPGHVDATRRREHGGQGGPLRTRRRAACGRRRRPARRTGRSTACTTATRRWAG